MTTIPRSQLYRASVSAASIVLALGALVACASPIGEVGESDAPSVATAEATPEISTEDTGDADPFASPDAAWQCGYVSSLEGLRVRASFLHDSGELDESSYQGRVAAIQDAWTNFPPGESSITAPLTVAIRGAANGVINNEEFSNAVAELAAECTDVGSLVASKLLPGQGG